MTYAGHRHGPGRRRLRVPDGSRVRCSRVGLLPNRFLLVGIAFEIALLVALLYVPPLQRRVPHAPLDGRTWPLLALWPVLVLGAEEARKAVLPALGTREAMT